MCQVYSTLLFRLDFAVRAGSRQPAGRTRALSCAISVFVGINMIQQDMNITSLVYLEAGDAQHLCLIVRVNYHSNVER